VYSRPLGRRPAHRARPAHGDDHGTVLDGVGHIANPGESDQGKGLDLVEPVSLVAGVQQPAQVLMLGRLRPEDSVGLVDEQDGRVGGSCPMDR